MNITCMLKGHDWDHCRCKRCGKLRNSHHAVECCGEVCRICGKTIDHDWEAVKRENCGPMDYDSASRPVNDFIVTLYKCKNCGCLIKLWEGDCADDPAQYTEITDEERRIYGDPDKG